ncbi:hypothetical protein UFOVP978_29 [uncultured Caudovirales phage]|uniref:Uncharacterized protein n=1 Tax=uncultured Caudovirales phage TaxID=2100421 RepID=A0A6J5Q288_9CAUD|nr:hypothetical protein UFOVP978_29 [uncultured Caudovirales phage]
MAKRTETGSYVVGDWMEGAYLNTQGTNYYSGDAVSVDHLTAKEVTDFVAEGVLVLVDSSPSTPTPEEEK